MRNGVGAGTVVRIATAGSRPVCRVAPAPLAVGNVAGFFREHRHVRRQRAQTLHDDLVRLRVRERQRRLVRLVRHFELLAVHAEDGVACAPREQHDL
jgi:hypothetical protein